jgi:hypothetical protein
MYEAQNPKDWRYILKDSEAKVAIVADQDIYDEIRPWTDEIETLERVIYLDGPADDEDAWARQIEIGQENPVGHVEEASHVVEVVAVPVPGVGVDVQVGVLGTFGFDESREGVHLFGHVLAGAVVPADDGVEGVVGLDAEWLFEFGLLDDAGHVVVHVAIDAVGDVAVLVARRRGVVGEFGGELGVEYGHEAAVERLFAFDWESPAGGLLVYDAVADEWDVVVVEALPVVGVRPVAAVGDDCVVVAFALPVSDAFDVGQRHRGVVDGDVVVRYVAGGEAAAGEESDGVVAGEAVEEAFGVLAEPGWDAWGGPVV